MAAPDRNDGKAAAAPADDEARGKAGRMAFLALMRFLSAGAAEFAPAAAGQVEATRGDGRRRTFPALVLAAALRRGLVTRDGGRVALSDAGAMALRRLLAGDEAAFAAQHRDIAVSGDGAGGFHAVNLAESPLGALARLKRKDGAPWFPEAYLRAGDRLRADFTRGQYVPGLTMRLEPVASRGSAARAGGIADLADAAVAARMRVDAALAAVGPELAGLLLDVCCFLKGLETVERERQWPQRSAKLMLSAGLDMLARHYDPPDTRPRPTRAWGAADYRPPITVDLS